MSFSAKVALIVNPELLEGLELLKGFEDVDSIELLLNDV